jgi:hypothetical protein
LRCSVSLAVALALAFSTEARAFNDATQFFVGATPHAATFGASGEGVYFTGAPRFSSLTCASCHTDGPGQVKLKLGADPPDLFTRGYDPGRTYVLEVELIGETKGLAYIGDTCTEPPLRGQNFTYHQCNNNGFGLEVDTADGTPLALPGTLCAEAPLANGMCPPANQADEVVIAPDGDAAFHGRAHDPSARQVVSRNDPRTWHLWWTAPAQGSGPLTIYVAGVDGNGGAGMPENDQDPYGDDTIQASFPIAEAGAPPPLPTQSGCDILPHPSASGFVLLALALLLLLARRRAN